MERPLTLDIRFTFQYWERFAMSPALARFVLAAAADDWPVAEAMMPTEDDPVNKIRFMQAKAELQRPEHREELIFLAEHCITTVLNSRTTVDDAYSNANFNIPTQRTAID